MNLQSTDYRDDITYFKEHFGYEIIHFDQLDLFDDLADVAALSQALDCNISVATAAATISAAVGTQTIIPTWKQSSWNNILFNSRGPAIDILLKNTSDSWGPVFEEVATKLKVLDAERQPFGEGEVVSHVDILSASASTQVTSAAAARLIRQRVSAAVAATTLPILGKLRRVLFMYVLSLAQLASAHVPVTSRECCKPV